MPGTERVLAGIDPEPVTRWLAGHVSRLVPPVGFALISGGRSNLTYRITDAAGGVYALRRPPTGGVLATAHDMSREWRFISAMAPTAVPVAVPLAYCADAGVTGAEFYVTGYVDGQVLSDRDAGLALAPEARATAGEQVIDVLVALHALDPAEIGLADLVRRTGYVERQLRRWHAQVHAAETAEHTSPHALALLDEVHGLLARRVPAQGNGVVHGDYRPGNMAFGPDGTVRAVFDWELATTGDPLADLGWLASTWSDPGDEVPPTTPGPSTAPGFPPRAELVARYARASGRDVSDLSYWVAFCRWRSACIGAGVRARYLSGRMADDGYLRQALERGDDGIRLAEAARDALRELPGRGEPGAGAGPVGGQVTVLTERCAQITGDAEEAALTAGGVRCSASLDGISAHLGQKELSMRRTILRRCRYWAIGGLAALVGLAVLAGPAGPARADDRSHLKNFQHVFVIMMENTGFTALIGNPNAPWINQAAHRYGLATSYFGVTHPSQPNYIAATSGSTNGVTSDNDVTVNVPNIVDQLQARGKTWKAYMQSFALCATPLDHACGNQLYERKHNPFVSYQDVQSNPARLANIVDLSQFSTDLADNNVPDFAWISPDQCHDMHGRAATPADPCDFSQEQSLIAAGDAFLRSTVSAIMRSRAWTGNSVIFITWDESDFTGSGFQGFGDDRGCCDSVSGQGGGQVVTLAISHSNHEPVTSNDAFNHYSMLATIEDGWHLGCLAFTCDTANVRPMSDLVGPRG